jgi:hypothetical protein
MLAWGFSGDRICSAPDSGPFPAMRPPAASHLPGLWSPGDIEGRGAGPELQQFLSDFGLPVN